MAYEDYTDQTYANYLREVDRADQLNRDIAENERYVAQEQAIWRWRGNRAAPASSSGCVMVVAIIMPLMALVQTLIFGIPPQWWGFGSIQELVAACVAAYVAPFIRVVALVYVLYIGFKVLPIMIGTGALFDRVSASGGMLMVFAGFAVFWYLRNR